MGNTGTDLRYVAVNTPAGNWSELHIAMVISIWERPEVKVEARLVRINFFVVFF
jgi:hypothetical protein